VVESLKESLKAKAGTKESTKAKTKARTRIAQAAKMVPSVEWRAARLVPKMVVLESVVKQAREAAHI